MSIGLPRFVGVTNDVFEDEQKHYVTIWLEADHESGEAAVNADYELSEVAWFPNDGLPEPLFPPLRRLLDGEALR